MADKDLNPSEGNISSVTPESSQTKDGQKSIQDAVELVNKGVQNLTASQLEKILKILAPYNNSNGAEGAAFAMASNFAEERLKAFNEGRGDFSPEEAQAFGGIALTLHPQDKDTLQQTAGQVEKRVSAYEQEERLDSLTPESAKMIEANYNEIEAFYQKFYEQKLDMEAPELAASNEFFNTLTIEGENTEEIKVQLREAAMLQAQTDLSINPAFQALSPEEKQKAILDAVAGNIEKAQLNMIMAQRELEFRNKNKELLNKQKLTDEEKKQLAELTLAYNDELAKEIEEYTAFCQNRRTGAGSKTPYKGLICSKEVAVGQIAVISNANLAKSQHIAKKTGFKKLWEKAKNFDAKMTEKHPKLWPMFRNAGISSVSGLLLGPAAPAAISCIRSAAAIRKSYREYQQSGGTGAGGYMVHLWKNPKELAALGASAAGSVLSSYLAGAELLAHGADSLGIVGQISNAGGIKEWYDSLDISGTVSRLTHPQETPSVAFSERMSNVWDKVKQPRVWGRAIIAGTSGVTAGITDYLTALKEKDPEKRKQLMKSARRSFLLSAAGVGAAFGVSAGLAAMQGHHDIPTGTGSSGNTEHLVGHQGNTEPLNDGQYKNMLLRNAQRHPELDVDKLYGSLKAQGIQNPEVAFYKLEQARLLAPNDPLMNEGGSIRETYTKALQGNPLNAADMKILQAAQNNVSNGGFYTNDVRDMGGTGYSYRPGGKVQGNDFENHGGRHGGGSSHGNGNEPDSQSNDEPRNDGNSNVQLVDISKLSANELALYRQIEAGYIANGQSASAPLLASQTFSEHQNLLAHGQLAEAESLLRSTHYGFESAEAANERRVAYHVNQGDDKGLIQAKQEAAQAYAKYQQSLASVKSAEAGLKEVQGLAPDNPSRVNAELKHAQAVKALVHDRMDMNKADVDLYKDQIRHHIDDAKDIRNDAKDAVKERIKDEKRIGEIQKELAKHGVKANPVPGMDGTYSEDKHEAKDYLKQALDNKKHSDKAVKLLNEQDRLLKKIASPTNQELAANVVNAEKAIAGLQGELSAIKGGDISKLPGYNMEDFKGSELAQAQTRVFREQLGVKENHGQSSDTAQQETSSGSVEDNKSEVDEVSREADKFKAELDGKIANNSTVSLSAAEKLSNNQFIKEADKLGNMQFVGKDADGNSFKLTKITNYGDNIDTIGVTYKLEVSEGHPFYGKLNASSEGLDEEAKFRTEMGKDLAAMKFASEMNGKLKDGSLTEVAGNAAAVVQDTYNSENLTKISDKMLLFKTQVDKGLIPSSVSISSTKSVQLELSKLSAGGISGEKALDEMQKKLGVAYDPERNVMTYKGKVFIDPLNNQPNGSKMVIYDEGDKSLDKRGFGKGRTGESPAVKSSSGQTGKSQER